MAKEVRFGKLSENSAQASRRTPPAGAQPQPMVRHRLGLPSPSTAPHGTTEPSVRVTAGALGRPSTRSTRLRRMRPPQPRSFSTTAVGRPLPVAWGARRPAERAGGARRVREVVRRNAARVKPAASPRSHSRRSTPRRAFERAAPNGSSRVRAGFEAPRPPSIGRGAAVRTASGRTRASPGAPAPPDSGHVDCSQPMRPETNGASSIETTRAPRSRRSLGRRRRVSNGPALIDH